MPAATMRANQLRLWFASMAYVLMCALRRIALAGTELARATCATIRLKLLKIGAQVTVSVRRVRVAMTTACPRERSSPTPTHDYDGTPRMTRRPPDRQPHRNTPEPAEAAFNRGSARIRAQTHIHAEPGIALDR